MLNASTYTAQADVRSAFQIQDLRTFRDKAGIPYAVVSHDISIGMISDVWFGGFKSESEFRAVLQFICERFDTGDYKYWMVDLRLLNTGFFHSDDWLAETVYPRAVAGGLEREAVVLPELKGAPPMYDVFGAASSALKKISDDRIRGFDDIMKARAWLLADGAPPLS